MSGKKRLLVQWSGLLILPVLFIWQGLDFTDMGWVLTSSRDVLSDPGNVPGQAYATFLSMLLNGLWMKVSSPFGLTGAKAGVVLVYWGIFTSSYFILRDFMSPRSVLLSLMLTFIFTQRNFWISYNNMTSLTACITLSFLYIGFRSGKGWYFAVSGILCSLNFFVRLPNILMISFGFLPLITQILFDTGFSGRKNWRETALFFTGYGGMFLSFIMFMAAGGYWEHYSASFIRIAGLSAKADYHHSILYLLRLLIEDYKKVLALAAVFSVTGAVIVSFLKKTRFPPLLVFSPFVLLSFYSGWRYFRTTFTLHPWFLWCAFFCSLFLIRRLFRSGGTTAMIPLCPYSSKMKPLAVLIIILLSAVTIYCLRGRRLYIYDPVTGVTYIVLFIALADAWRKREKNLFFALLSALAMLVTVPLGSNNGIRNSTYGLWLALPLVLNYFGDYTLKNFFSLRTAAPEHSHASFWFGGAVLIFLLAAGSALTYRYTYRDTFARSAMRYSIDHPMLRSTYTTKERAFVVKELLGELQRRVRPGDFLLGYHTVSTLYYLTGTRPYLYNSWPFLYEPEQLRFFLEKAGKERPGKPVVVRSKYSLQNFEWPKGKYRNRTVRYEKNLKIMDGFLQKQGYRKSWENEIFEILVIPEESR